MGDTLAKFSKCQKVQYFYAFYHIFERIDLDTTWGLPAKEISWKLMDPMQTTHRFEGIF
jgi:hypothetical protein